MAQVTLTIPDEIAPRVLDAVCSRHGYQATLPNGDPNPQTQINFAKQVIYDFLKRTVRVYEISLAEQAASAAASNAVNNDINFE